MGRERQKREKVPAPDNWPVLEPVLKELDITIPMGGGWGYSKEDAVVIEADNYDDGIAMEYEFAERRVELECAVLSSSVPCEIANFHPLRQRLEIHDDVPYDVIESSVTVDFDDKEELVTFDVECWCNIKSFFGKF